jgi:hypothetical protein
MEMLKRLSLVIFDNNQSDENWKKWIEFREGVRKMCNDNDNELEMFEWGCNPSHERQRLTWVD